MIDLRRKSVTILQPSYIPWVGYFNQIVNSDYFIFYDDVQYDKNGWRNRNKIVLNKKLHWLTVPIIQNNKFGQLIKDAKIDYQKDWIKKHLENIKHAYKKAAYFEYLYPLLSHEISKKYDFLADLNINLVTNISHLLGIKTQFFRSSDFDIQGDRSTRLLGLCKKLKAGSYKSGISAKDYLDVDIFKKSNINVEWQNFIFCNYSQLTYDFIPYASIIDLVFNEGSNSINYIKADRF
jgi:hypothetical protein